MTDKPILFSGQMVKAILDGRKTMTRRTIKVQPPADVTCADNRVNADGWTNKWTWWSGDPQNFYTWTERGNFKLPYAPGDLLWVRESFIPDPSLDDDAWDDAPMSATEWDGCGRRVADVPLTLRTPENVIYKADPEYARNQDWLWRPSIHMPRWASRITLRVTAVKVERLQDISEDDAKAEGVEKPILAHWPNLPFKSAFRGIWLDLHGRGAWDANPWVAAYSFERVKP